MEAKPKTQKENEDRVAEEYLSSLTDLNCNSKPLINMLTMLAEENIEYAPIIVKVVEEHIAKVPPDFKLPILYLIDSIVKNVKGTYVQLFSQCIVNIFCGVFEKVAEKVRERMYALRQTWNDVFTPPKLYALDVKVKDMDHNWPITAKPSIHVNPNFLKQAMQTEYDDILHAKTRELLELKKRKLELELEATKKHLAAQEKQLSKTTETVIPPVESLVAAVAAGRPVPLAAAAAGLDAALVAPGLVAPALVADPRTGPVFHAYQNASKQPPPHQPTTIPGIDVQNYAGPPQSMLAKPKVNPVNPALVNSSRPRDPRLARQQQQMIQTNADRDAAVKPPHDKGYTNAASSKHSGSSSRARASSERDAKGAGRNAGAASGSSERSSSGRPKNRERMRSDSKASSGSSYSSSGSTVSADRRRQHCRSASSRSRSKESDAKYDHSSAAGSKRKSSSPAGGSPSHAKDSKRPNKARSSSAHPHHHGGGGGGGHKHRSLSRSPIHEEEMSPEERHFRGTSQPKHAPTTHNAKEDQHHHKAGHAPKEFDKMPRPPAFLDLKAMSASEARPNRRQDIDLRPSLFPSHLDMSRVDEPTPPSSSSSASSRSLSSSSNSAKPVPTTKSSPKVSFKVQKLFNKLDKSTVHLSTAAAAKQLEIVVASNSAAAATSLKTHSNGAGAALDGLVDTGKKGGDGLHAHDDLRKRQIPQNNAADDTSNEPLTKKSKGAKMDALFGYEDVDLRTSMPPSHMLRQPGKKIGDDEGLKLHQNIENVDSLMADVSAGSSPKTSPQKKKPPSNFDDVRAKFAKINKNTKIDKISKELSQRIKLAELTLNEDTQEAHDEKMRSILAHAQELLQTGAITAEQYKQIVHTIVAAGDKAKDAAKQRRDRELAEEENDIDLERMAARDAVLKKRIPKLNKAQQLSAAAADEAHGGENAGGNSPYYEDKNSEEGGGGGGKQKYNNNNAKDKRPKNSKWSAGDKGVATGPSSVNNNNNNNMEGMRGGQWMAAGPAANRRPAGFRQNAQMPGQMPPQMPWNMNGPGGPGQVGPVGPVAGPMNAAMPPFAGMIRGQMPPNALPAAGPMVPKPCNSIDNPQADLVRSITIDGHAKEIRIYDQTSIVFMDQPREIGFQDGQRALIIDNSEPITLHFNDQYKTCLVNGVSHRLRFGFPSRELYIDDNWYEIYFGGPPVQIPLRTKMCLLKAEGPPPQVNFGPVRHDLVVGKLNMIIDAHTVIPLFLDAKLQKFRLGGEEHTIQFADNLLTLLLDGEARQVEYGGLPKSFAIGAKKYFVRFTALPPGIVAGKVHIKDMLHVKTEPSPAGSLDSGGKLNNNKESTDGDMLPLGGGFLHKLDDNSNSNPVPSGGSINPVAALGNINVSELFKQLVSSGIISTATAAVAPSAKAAAPKPAAKPESPVPVEKEKRPTDSPLTVAAAVEPEVPKEPHRPIDLSKPETIKARQSSIVHMLYHGMQCSSCGVRFPPEQTIKYSQHLDWHFRQNRRERDLLRKATSRKWFYELNDWLQYEEIEDAEEREKNFFESQQTELELHDEGSSSQQRSLNSPLVSCPAGPDDVDRACDMCHEKFEQFYNEELEEWHLRCAIRVEEKIYHPLCYEDYRVSLKALEQKKAEEAATAKAEPAAAATAEEDVDMEADKVVVKTEEETSETEKKAGADQVTYVEDDDDVIVLPNEEPSVTEIVDDDDDEDDGFVAPAAASELPASKSEPLVEEPAAPADCLDDTDVEIQEPHIPFTDLDTYEESQHADDTSNLDLLNVKIKEEPKDDYERDEEDDGFEEVGTIVVCPDEEISIHSEDTRHSSPPPAGPPAADEPQKSPASAAAELVEGEAAAVDSATAAAAPDAVDLSMEGNLEGEGEHNLSTAGPAPAVPIASLMNKIKINITKNTVNSHSSSTAGQTAPASRAHANSSSTELNTCNVSQITVVSTIPVLCGGGVTTTCASVLIPVGGGAANNGNKASAHDGGSGGNGEPSVSSISVIGGSYGGAGKASSQSKSQPAAAAPTTDGRTTPEAQPEKTAAADNVKIVKAGVETSGLCSIM